MLGLLGSLEGVLTSPASSSLTSTWIYTLKIRRISIEGHLGRSAGQVSDFGSGHDHAVCGFELLIGLSTGGTEPAWDSLSSSLSLSLCLFPTCTLSLSLSLSQNK